MLLGYFRVPSFWAPGGKKLPVLLVVRAVRSVLTDELSVEASGMELLTAPPELPPGMATPDGPTFILEPLANTGLDHHIAGARHKPAGFRVAELFGAVCYRCRAWRVLSDSRELPGLSWRSGGLTAPSAQCSAQHVAHAQQVIHRYGRSSSWRVCGSLRPLAHLLLVTCFPGSSDCASSPSSGSPARPLWPPRSTSNMLSLCLAPAGHTLTLELCTAASWVSLGGPSSQSVPDHLKQSHAPSLISNTSPGLPCLKYLSGTNIIGHHICGI